MSSNFVDFCMFKISPKVQKSLWFVRAQLLMVSDLLLGTVECIWVVETDGLFAAVYSKPYPSNWQSYSIGM